MSDQNKAKLFYQKDGVSSVGENEERMKNVCPYLKTKSIRHI